MISAAVCELLFSFCTLTTTNAFCSLVVPPTAGKHVREFNYYDSTVPFERKRIKAVVAAFDSEYDFCHMFGKS